MRIVRLAFDDGPDPDRPSPAPIARPAAALPARRAAAAGEDPDARCAPFLQGFADSMRTPPAMAADAVRPSAARSRRRHRPIRPTTGPAPAPTSPPPPPPHRQAEMRANPRRASRGSQPEPGDRRTHRPALFTPILSGSAAGESRALCRPRRRRRAVGRRGAGLDLLDRRRHRLLRQCPPDAEPGAMPPQAAVRTEELLNYFRYDYPADRSLAAVQRQRRHDDDAVESGIRAPARRPSRL